MENKTLTLKINDIIVTNRQRTDLGDIDNLAASLSQFGLLQPIVVTQDRRLIAGGRRLEAAKQLAWKEISVVYRETLSEEELHLLELEENIRRKDMTWQEKCLNIATIHRLKEKTASLNSERWNQRATAELLQVDSVRDINHALQMATWLEAEMNSDRSIKEDARFWKEPTMRSAFDLHWRDEEARGHAELASRHQAQSIPIEIYEEEQTMLTAFEEVESSTDALREERERYYTNPHNPPDSFEEYWKGKQKWAEQAKQTIHLSSKLIKGDSIKFMHENPERFDHIITDIPYGIDLDMISQSSNGFKDIDTVEELHDVEYNMQLIADFFPAAFECTKDQAFVVTWCDHMVFKFMYDCAIKAGFAVQRWPIIWPKNSAKNSCTAYNTTKDFEEVIVCRKKNTIICNQPNTSFTPKCGKDELCADIKHPFAKPFLVWEFLIKTFTLEGQSVLEPFAGGGSGVISLLKMNRNPVGVELDETHYNALLENVKQLFYLKLNPNFIFK